LETEELKGISHSTIKSDRGLVQIFTGDGKGKTTAAIGTIVRALGHNLRIYVAVFMKGHYPYGEWKYLAGLPGITVERFGTEDFCDPSNIKPEEMQQARLALEAAGKALHSGEYDVVVLDEVNVAVGWKLIPLADVVTLIEGRPAAVELILTGRRADAELVKRADLVTEMLKIKHPMDKGVGARPGFEY
jgi:cob(I)alamin adenosyltransferase